MGKLIGICKRFGLQNALLKDSMDHSSFTKDTWESYDSLWNPFFKWDVLSLAFIKRRYSDEIYDIEEFCIQDCLTTSSLGWKLKMSLCQDELIYTYNQNTRHFIGEA